MFLMFSAIETDVLPLREQTKAHHMFSLGKWKKKSLSFKITLLNRNVTFLAHVSVHRSAVCSICFHVEA